jgi:hypothetical protein
VKPKKSQKRELKGIVIITLDLVMNPLFTHAPIKASGRRKFSAVGDFTRGSIATPGRWSFNFALGSKAEKSVEYLCKMLDTCKRLRVLRHDGMPRVPLHTQADLAIKGRGIAQE